MFGHSSRLASGTYLQNVGDDHRSSDFIGAVTDLGAIPWQEDSALASDSRLRATPGERGHSNGTGQREGTYLGLADVVVDVGAPDHYVSDLIGEVAEGPSLAAAVVWLSQLFIFAD